MREYLTMKSETTLTGEFRIYTRMHLLFADACFYDDCSWKGIRQDNEIDCGVYVLLFIKHALECLVHPATTVATLWKGVLESTQPISPPDVTHFRHYVTELIDK